MNSFLFLLLCCLTCQLSFGQQWIDKQYTYDSLLNVPYGTAVNFAGELETLHMDIFLPRCQNSGELASRPLMMWIHGGAFLAGSKDEASLQAYCRDFARRGYVTATINYRLGFVADEAAWQCNYPQYNCIFATDPAEWPRAYYRAVQDGKGALRYLINRHEQFGIDPGNVFVSGESAGAFVALGVGLMDSPSERPVQTFALPPANRPSPNTANCSYNAGVTFTGSTVARPDLGGIDGNIEPSNINFTIKGIGNMYGAMYVDLLRQSPANKPKPSIYSFHQACDIIVPIDSNYVNWGLTWCFTNGYNCSGIINNEVMLYGSRTFSNWNMRNSYGYNIKDEFLTTPFPYSFVFGQGSCLDQVNKPCHAYDNRALRERNLSLFFADQITTPACRPRTVNAGEPTLLDQIKIYPNPVAEVLTLQGKTLRDVHSLSIHNALGTAVYQSNRQEVSLSSLDTWTLDFSSYPTGLYFLHLQAHDGSSKTYRVIHQ